MSTPVIILNNSPATWLAVAMPADAHVDFARIGFGVGDELRNGLGGTDGLTTITNGNAEDARDRRDVADEIEIELVVERRVDRVSRVPTRRSV